MEAGVSGFPALDHLAKRGHEVTRFLDGDDPGQRLLNQFVGSETQQVEYGVVRLKNLAVEIGDKHGIGRILDEALRIRTRLVQLADVAEDTDDTDRRAVR